MSIINLKSLRQEAKISQEEMARLLSTALGESIGLAEVQRYEENPGRTFLNAVTAWQTICDVRIKNNFNASSLLFEGSQWPKFHQNNTRCAQSLFDLADRINIDYAPEMKEELESTAHMLQAFAAKPIVTVMGYVSVGKSSILNFLSQRADLLPEGLLPTTSIITYLIHTDDRPDYITDDVWLMDKAFKLSDLHDQAICEAHCKDGGSYEKIREQGSHYSKSQKREIGAALVFSDAPVLEHMTLIDIPGLGNNKTDDELIKNECLNGIADMVLYIITPDQTPTEQDAPTLHIALSYLKKAYDANRLEHLFILVNKMDALNQKAQAEVAQWEDYKEQMFANFGMSDRYFQQHKAAFLRQMYPFSTEDLRYTESALFALKRAFKQTCEFYQKLTFDYLTKIKSNGGEMITKRLAQLDLNFDALKTELSGVEELKDFVQNELPSQNSFFFDLVEIYKNKNLDIISKLKAKYSQRYITQIISNTYESPWYDLLGRGKLEAQKQAPQYIISLINEDLSHEAEKFSQEFSAQFMQKIQSLDTEMPQVGALFAFNTNAAILGGMVGLSSLGALSVWTAITASGSSYFLSASTLSWLTTLGITMGSSRLFFPILGGLVGPIGLWIAISAMISTTVWSIFKGLTWQENLAKNILNRFDKSNFWEKLEQGVQTYWEDTKTAVEQGLDGMLETLNQEIDRLTILKHQAVDEAAQREHWQWLKERLESLFSYCLLMMRKSSEDEM